jgi:signal transduction histidine kinase
VLLFRRNKGRITILHGAQVINALLQIFSTADNRIDVCGNYKFPPKIFSFKSVNKLRLDAVTRNRNLKQRYIFQITKESVPYCKELMRTGNNELRHMDDIEANFAVNEKEYLGSITFNEIQQQAIYSNMTEILEQQHSIFDTLWDKSVPAEDTIKNIEEGVEPEFIEIITDPHKATGIYIDLAKSIDKEGLILLADSKAMIRADRLGIIDYLIEASSQKHATLKIICPLSEENSYIVKRILNEAPAAKIVNSGSSHSGMFIVDSKKFLRFELKDPKAEEFSDAIGFIVYSNGKVSVSSSKSFFELIWNEHIQYEKIKEYERQKEGDKLKDEFINVAAHELRTPIQPILGLSQVLRSGKVNSTDYHKYLDTIIRNAKRLQRLADSILDVTRIESQSLKLNKEQVKLEDIITEVIEDYRDQIEKRNDNNKRSLKLLYEPGEREEKEYILVEADKARLVQVISNLLNNAITFTKQGVISVSSSTASKVQEIGSSSSGIDDGGCFGKDIVVVRIKDTGVGIDQEMLPRLFSRFISKSYQGTGLGLFISKSIIEAHGGRIWAENNADGKGAAFYFSLPLVKITSSRGT